MAAWPAWVLWLLGGWLSAAGLLIAAWALFRDRARGRRRCPSCWYDLSAAKEPLPTCPECGYLPGRPRALLKTRRRWRWALAGFALLLAGAAAALTPALRAGGWHRWVPSTALIIALPWTDQPWPWDELDRRLDYNEPGIQWLRREALWDWQWRFLARRAGAAAVSDAPASIRTRALTRILNGCPDPRPAAKEVAACLQDSDRKVRWLAAWGIKAARLDWGEHRPMIVAALKSAPETLWSGTDLRALALDWFSGPTEPSSPPNISNPEEIERFLSHAAAANLSAVHRSLGAFSRTLFWPYNGDSGPLRVQRFDLEIDGRPGNDAVVRISDASGAHWEMLVFIRRSDQWVFGGCIGIPNQAVRPPEPRAERSPDGRTWLVIRSCMGADGGGISYALFADNWLIVEPGRITPALQTAVDGYSLRPGPATQAAAAWKADSAPPRLLSSPSGLTLEYDLTIRTGMVLPNQGGAGNPPAPPVADAPLFTREATVRFAWDRRHRVFLPLPSDDPWAQPSGLMDTLLGGPDRFITTAAADLLPIAQRGTPDQRSWLRIYLGQCAPSPQRDALDRALGPDPPPR